MIETLGRLELPESVAGRTVAVAELAAMGILVTGGAAGLEAEVGALEVDGLGQQLRRVDDRLPAVAAAAGERQMRALERVAGRRVVERLLAGLAPVDQGEIASLMLDVTALALAVVGAGVQTLAGGDALRQRLVAGETAPAIDAVLGAVAVQAAVAAVELGVGAAQLTGRDLCAGRRRAGKRPPDPGDDRGRGEAPSSCPAANQWPILA
jgi:hypothetical protein